MRIFSNDSFILIFAVHINVSKVSTKESTRRMGCNLEARNSVTRKEGRSLCVSIKQVSYCCTCSKYPLCRHENGVPNLVCSCSDMRS